MSILADIKIGDPESAAAQYQTAGYQLAYEAGAGDLVEFQREGHIYRLRSTGEILPSVTGILRDTGISVDFDELGGMRSDIKHAIALKRDIGVAVHQAAHYYDDDDLAWDSVDPDVRPYLDCWVEFRKNYAHLIPATRERIVYHPTFRFVGTLDAIFFEDGETEINITERWSVQLVPGRKVPYRVTPYSDWLDQEKFKAFATTWWCQNVRRRAA